MEEKEVAVSPRQREDSHSPCPICYDKFWSDVVWQCRSCKAEYHFLCILEWLLRKYNCPCCRANARPIFNIIVNQEVFVLLPTTPSELTVWLKQIHFLILQSFQAAAESSGEGVVGYGIPMAIQFFFKLTKHWLWFILPHLVPILILIFLYISKMLQMLVRVLEGNLIVLIWVISTPFRIISFIARNLNRLGHAAFGILWSMIEQRLQGELVFNPRSHTSDPLLQMPVIGERG